MANEEQIIDDELVPGVSINSKKTTEWQDPSGEYPLGPYSQIQSTNKAATGGKINTLFYGGGDEGVSLNLKKAKGSQYPLNQVRETRSGHVTEYDDTPGSERILIKHRTGSGVECRADGTVIVSSKANKIEVSGGDQTVIIEGDGQISYKGNMTLNVSGNLDFNVGGNYNLKVAGDKVETIDGSFKQRIYRNKDVMTLKNEITNTIGNRTDFVFGDQTMITKGFLHEYIQKEVHRFGGEKIYTTAEDEYIISSPNINITASNLSVLGDSGTIGGENIVMYNYNMYTGHSITSGDTISTNTAIVTERTTSKEFVGSLTGNADTATEAGKAGTAGVLGASGSAGTKVTGSPTAVDPKATALPTPTLITDLLANPENKQVKDMEIDEFDSVQNGWDKTFDYGGVAFRPLTTGEVRSKIRDPNNYANQKFIGAQVAEGKLSPSYAIIAPPSVKRTYAKGKSIRGSVPIGNSSVGSSKRVKG